MITVLLAMTLISGVTPGSGTNNQESHRDRVQKYDLYKNCGENGLATEPTKDSYLVEAANESSRIACQRLFEDGDIIYPAYRQAFLEMACTYCQFGNESSACLYANSYGPADGRTGVDNYLYRFAHFFCA